jgi:coenzyme F420-0:L-glutamate ligase/coenzyme F420-1:gamma-L-glutamate ligase
MHLRAEGWATRWEPVATPGASSLVGRLWLGSDAEDRPAGAGGDGR